MWFFLLEMIMKKMINFYSALLILFFFLLAFPQNIFAHFGMVIPSDSMIMQEDNRNINVTLSFSHPFEMKGMELEKPVRFDVVFDGEKSDLLETLRKTQVMGHTGWETDFL
jgi:cobalt/nickel transport protein